MKLTGKSKEEFEKWYLLDYKNKPFIKQDEQIDTESEDKKFKMNIFYKALSDSMQYGVYVDWFDSVGLFVTDGRHRMLVHDNKTAETFIFSGIRLRTQAIKKANEIFNNR